MKINNKTKNNFKRKIKDINNNEYKNIISSYLGYLKYGSTNKLIYLNKI